MFDVEYKCPNRPVWYYHGSCDDWNQAVSAAVNLHYRSKKSCRVLDDQGRQVFLVPKNQGREPAFVQCGR